MLDRRVADPSRLSVGWVGPTSNPCGKLIERIEQHGRVSGRRVALRFQSHLDLPELLTCDRIILCCPTRLDYPMDWIQALTASAPEIPWAIVTDHWHAGSRRSGIGVTTHWMQPWYRWWESWLSWLFPSAARPGATPPALFQALTLPGDWAASAQEASKSLTSQSRPQRAVIGLACACPMTAQAWQLMAEQVGCEVIDTSIPTRSTEERRSLSTNMKYLLWDDSLLSCLPDGQLHQQLTDQLTSVRKDFPDATILAALSLCHLDLYDSGLAAGASDILIKPSYGMPLADYLYHHLNAVQAT